MSPFSEAVAAAVNPYLVDSSSPTKAPNPATTITLHSAPSANEMQQTSFVQPSSATSGSITGGPPKRPTLHRELSREDMDLEVSTVQKDLDHLKDMLSGQITLDSSLISNLFNPDESLSSLFAGQDLNFGAFSPPTTTSPSNPSTGILQSLEMETPTSKENSALSGIISPGALTTTQTQPAAAHQVYVQQQDELEDQPNLFEFADIDDDIDVVGQGTTENAGEKQKHSRGSSSTGIKMNLVPQEDLSLNTPLISSGDDQDNPLLRSIRKRK